MSMNPSPSCTPLTMGLGKSLAILSIKRVKAKSRCIAPKRIPVAAKTGRVTFKGDAIATAATTLRGSAGMESL